MAREEQVVGVVVELRSLVLAERVFERELVEAELGLQLVHPGSRGPAVVDPHDGPRHREELRHVPDRKALLDQLPVAVRPGVGHVSERRQPDRRSLFFFCLSARFSLSDLPGFFALCFSGTLFAMPPA